MKNVFGIHNSVVECGIADPEVTGSIPVGCFFASLRFLMFWNTHKYQTSFLHAWSGLVNAHKYGMHTIIDVAVQTRTLRSATFTTHASPLKPPPRLPILSRRWYHPIPIFWQLSTTWLIQSLLWPCSCWDIAFWNTLYVRTVEVWSALTSTASSQHLKKGYNERANKYGQIAFIWNFQISISSCGSWALQHLAVAKWLLRPLKGFRQEKGKRERSQLTV